VELHTSPSIAGEITLVIGGMTCASCVARVEKALRAVPGVVSASVNLATERAAVAALADPSGRAGALEAALVAALDRIGYEGQVVSEGADENAVEERSRDLERHERLRVAVALLLAAPLVAPMLALLAGRHLALPGVAQLALATPVQFWLGARFYRAGWKALASGSANMDVLVALGTTAAYALSVGELAVHGSHAAPLYFESSAVVIALVLLGKWLEARARRSAADAVRGLRSLMPLRAHLLRGDQQIDVPVTAVGGGDTIAVLPGERVPTDGVVVDGRTELDESLVTGESLPVPAEPGSRVIGGSLNGSGLIRLTVSAVASAGTLARITRLVEHAQASKAPIQRLVDRVAGVFVPLVLLIAIATALGWWFAGTGLDRALLTAVAVLVIACPCALGLATPAALVAGTGAAARAGILIRDAEVLEHAARIRLVLFDKTGTLTLGRPRLVARADFGPPRSAAQPCSLAIAAALQRGSEHPLARAVLTAASEAGLAGPSAEELRADPGRGIRGRIGAQNYALGSARHLRELGVPVNPADAWAATEASAGRAVALLAVLGAAPRVLAGLAFADEPRPSAAAAVARLREAGITSVLVTGDHAASARVLAAAVGIERVYAGMLPEEKLRLVRELSSAEGAVAMVGDGINDAPALAAADLGIAMGSGTDVANAAAGISLARSDPRAVADAIDVARRTRRKIRTNLLFASIYNLAGIPLAAAGVLSPVIAGLAMALSSVSVVTNALVLARWRPPR
jgi:Cu+-exporting ATPase